MYACICECVKASTSGTAGMVLAIPVFERETMVSLEFSHFTICV